MSDMTRAEKTETVTEFADRCRECGRRYIRKSVIRDIKAELTNLADADAYGDYQFGVNFGLMKASQIIDKYMRGTENELTTEN